jgi:hypothetical protein
MQSTACEKKKKTLASHRVKSSATDRQFSKPLLQTSTNQFKNSTSIMESNISKFSANIMESGTLGTLLVFCQALKLYYTYLEIWLML